MKKIVLVLIALIILFSTLFVEIQSEKSIVHETVSLEINNKILSATFSIEEGITGKVPGVIVFHGFSGNKEMMRPFTEGLALYGFGVLTVDQEGHGSSSGNLREFGEDSLMKDGIELVKYLRERSEIDENSIGVLGHSMGGSTSIQISLNDSSIKSTVIIGNDLNGYNINETNPQNLLMAIGEYEELFSVEDAFDNLEKAVGTTVEEGISYGDFQLGTARKIIVPKTNHIFEVGNAEIIKESIEWTYNSLKAGEDIKSEENYSENIGWNMMARALSSLISGILWMSLIPIVFYYANNNDEKTINQSITNEINQVSHGIISFTAFVIGAIFLVFGFSGVFVGWFLMGSLFYMLALKRNRKITMRLLIRELFDSNLKRNTILGLIAFLSIFIPLQIILHTVHWDFRYILPFFSELDFRRLLLMFVFWIPGTLYFIFEIQYLGYDKQNNFKSFIKYSIARTWPFIIILLIQYVPIILTGNSVLPGMFGFLAFFIVGLLPIMIVLSLLTVISNYLKIHAVSTAIVMAGYIAWDLASTLPFN